MTLSDFIRDHAIIGNARRAEANPNMVADAAWNRTASHWIVTLQRPDSEPMHVPFSQGSAHTEPPTAANVLGAIADDAAGVANAPDWLEWADEYGFLQDTDAASLRQARETHETITRQSGELQTFLGDDAFDVLLWHTDRD